MMDNGNFQFQNVLVVANGPNIFSEQLALEQRNIPFELFTGSKPEKVETNPDLILIVNKGTETVAVPFKQHFPEAQVVICRGGSKNFSPSLLFICGEKHHDVHWFADWDEFIGLIGNWQEPLPILISPKTSEGDIYSLFGNMPPDSYSHELRPVFECMLNASKSYLTWYLEWLEEVSELSFECDFKLRRRQKRVRRVVIPVQKCYTYKGMPVFREESLVTFYNQREWPCVATVQKITEAV